MHDNLLTMADWMTKDPATVEAKQTIGEALVLMYQREIRHLPVIEQERLVGVLSDRDIRQLLGKVRVTSAERSDEERYLRMPVSEIMTAHPVKVKSETAIREAVQMMVDRKFGSLPVVDTENRVIGIFTEFDALRYCLYLIDRYQKVG